MKLSDIECLRLEELCAMLDANVEREIRGWRREEVISVPARGGNSGWKSASMRKAIAILI
jgi:hypothetical protein